jgi:hypothetical protein
MIIRYTAYVHIFREQMDVYNSYGYSMVKPLSMSMLLTTTLSRASSSSKLSYLGRSSLLKHVCARGNTLSYISRMCMCIDMYAICSCMYIPTDLEMGCMLNLRRRPSLLCSALNPCTGSLAHPGSSNIEYVQYNVYIYIFMCIYTPVVNCSSRTRSS